MPSLRQLRVFVADDSPLIRERVAALLVADGMAVVGEGTTPHECVEGILATRPDVVVLDAQLEGGTGLDVLRDVSPRDPAVRFVAFSSNAAPAYRKRYMEAGALDFLDKATEFGRLVRAVADAGATSGRRAAD